MSVYKATSWGRTRRPKSLRDDNAVGTKETPSAITVATASTDLRNSLDSIAFPHVNGVVTENQRYLHVYVEGAGTRTAQIYGYNYAFGKWAPIMEHDGDGTRSIMAASTDSGAARHYIFEIAGIDRVAFVKSTTDAPTLYAAASTF
tara:strand:- start:1192 stop:1629 length:438 start_codon:yes stop_codon:yes gene_type:complete